MRKYTIDAIPPLVSDDEWGPVLRHDGSGERPADVPADAIVMLAWNAPVHQTPLTWAYAARRAAPAGERDWGHVTTYRVKRQSIGAKVEHVREAIATDTGAHRHHCHWPGCREDVPPATWGCYRHWKMLPKHLRDRIWATYRPGQEISKTPSRDYVEAAREVQRWIEENHPPERTLFG